MSDIHRSAITAKGTLQLLQLGPVRDAQLGQPVGQTTSAGLGTAGCTGEPEFLPESEEILGRTTAKFLRGPKHLVKEPEGKT
jgi:hypothetical protein